VRPLHLAVSIMYQLSTLPSEAFATYVHAQQMIYDERQLIIILNSRIHIDLDYLLTTSPTGDKVIFSTVLRSSSTLALRGAVPLLKGLISTCSRFSRSSSI